jgi:hypothetical protein
MVDLPDLTAPTRLVTQTNWVVTAACLYVFVARFHGAEVARRIDYVSRVDAIVRSICASIFSTRNPRIDR